MQIDIYLFNRKCLGNIQVTSSAWQSDSTVRRMGPWFNCSKAILIFKDWDVQDLFSWKSAFFNLFFFLFLGHLGCLEANDSVLYGSAYLNSSMCHCSSKSCRFQFQYSMADSSVLKAVLYTNQVRSMHSFSNDRDATPQFFPSKLQVNTRYHMLTSPLVCVNSHFVLLHCLMQL